MAELFKKKAVHEPISSHPDYISILPENDPSIVNQPDYVDLRIALYRNLVLAQAEQDDTWTFNEVTPDLLVKWLLPSEEWKKERASYFPKTKERIFKALMTALEDIRNHATGLDQDALLPPAVEKVADRKVKDSTSFKGLPLAIEYPEGSTRKGTAPDGTKWERPVVHPYGYIKKTDGADGDSIDCYVGPSEDSDLVYVVNQFHPDGSFDEHKVLLGFDDAHAALQGYLVHMPDDWAQFGPLQAFTLAEFKHWLQTGDTSKTASGEKPKAVWVIASEEAVDWMVLGTLHGVKTASGEPLKPKTGEVLIRMAREAFEEANAPVPVLGGIPQWVLRDAALRVPKGSQVGVVGFQRVEDMKKRFEGRASVTQLTAGYYDPTGNKPGKLLSENPKYRGQHVYIYRGLPEAAGPMFNPNDYVCLGRKFAEEHADTTAVYEEEPCIAIKAFVPAEHVAEAYNPGEYFYVGPKPIKGRVIYKFDPETGEGVKLAKKAADDGPDTGDHGATTDDSGQFWGDAGAGCVFLAQDTGRLLISFRSEFVNEPHTWGVWGGAIDGKENPAQAALREVREETGYRGQVHLKEAYVYTNGKFKYTTFLAIVPKEFVPRLDWETEDFQWCDREKLPNPIHFGLKEALPSVVELADEVRPLGSKENDKLKDALGQTEHKEAATIQDGVYSMPLSEAIDEHEKLVDALVSPGREDDAEEIREQGAELQQMKTARPSDVTFMKKMPSLTPEMLQEAAKVNNDRYMEWVLQQMVAGKVHLPEDGNALREGLRAFVILSHEPSWTGSRDIKTYSPEKLVGLIRQGPDPSHSGLIDTLLAQAPTFDDLWNYLETNFRPSDLQDLLQGLGGAAGLRQQWDNIHGEEADQPKSLDTHRISPRKPTTKKLDTAEDPHGKVKLQPEIKAWAKKPEALEKAVQVFQSYPGFGNIKKGSVEQKANLILNQLVDNLVWLYNQVPPEQRQRSKMWYTGGNRLIHRWARQFNLDPHKVAGVIAVLSPQRDWFQNVSLAERVLDVVINHQNDTWGPDMTKAVQDWVAAANEEKAKAKATAERKKQRLLEEAAAAKKTKRKTRAAAVEEAADEGDDETKDVDPNLMLQWIPLCEGKTFKAVANEQDLAALWIRAFDQARNNRRYRIVSPEGEFGDWSRKTDLSAGTATWGSLAFIWKAIEVINSPSIKHISDVIGENHKVRSFYNNLIAPYSKGGDVTIDTHAVAAALVRPLAGSSVEVNHNFGTTKKGDTGPKPTKDAVGGNQGTYAIYADAYRLAAKKVGVSPREMQSITWEAVRGLFKAHQKNDKALRAKIINAWKDVSHGTITAEQARNTIRDEAKGFEAPAWAGSHYQPHDYSRHSSYKVQLPEHRGPDGGPGEPGRGGGSQPPTRAASPRRGMKARLFQKQATAWFGKKVWGDPTTGEIIICREKANDPDLDYHCVAAAAILKEREGQEFLRVTEAEPALLAKGWVRAYAADAGYLQANGWSSRQLHVAQKIMQGVRGFIYVENGTTAAAAMPAEEFCAINSRNELLHLFRAKLTAKDKKADAPPVHELQKSPAQLVEEAAKAHPLQAPQRVDPTQTPEFKAWFKNSKVVDRQGRPLVVYHGSTHAFDKFDASSGNEENFYGKAFYFTDSSADAGSNYGSPEGRDLQSRIEQRAEYLMDYAENEAGELTGMVREDAYAQARKEIMGQSQGMVYLTYLRILNPVVVVPNGGTHFEGGTWNPRNDDEWRESQVQGRLYKATLKASSELGADGERIWEAASGELGFAEGFTAHQFESAIREGDETYDVQGGPGPLIARIWQLMGFDGIIMDASAQFPSMKLSPGTKHYIVWNPRQVKSALGNSGKFNPRSPRMVARLFRRA